VTQKLILVTGATGYIASRLIPRLLEQGYSVRALARRPEQLTARPWGKSVELLCGDISDPKSLELALGGVHTAYYLIHNMTIGRGYTRVENEGALNFAAAAERAHVQHIIYLGGLADPNDKHIASHLRSRLQTGEMLRRGKVPVTEFRSGVIAGSGSVSFEMIRFMTEALPLMVGPAWLKNKSQPIAIENIIDYLISALEKFDSQNGVFEIGGDEVTTYADLMLRYARIRGLKRNLLMLPGIPLWFMAWGVGMMTPVSRRIAYALIGGLASDSIVQHDEARRVFPNVKLINFEDATANALRNFSPSTLERVWEGWGRNAIRIKHEGFFIDYRRVEINASSKSVYQVITSMGGKRGWIYLNWLWQLRGWIDKALGGVGSRGRKDSLEENDIMDYYRVESLQSNHLMRLHSELRAPGQGWMEWRVDSDDRSELVEERCVLTQTAFFAPRGSSGFLYWYLLNPIHRFVFHGLIQAIKHQCEKP
jgi:uncharacterized protein YbjT (DUF2867 family)